MAAKRGAATITPFTIPSTITRDSVIPVFNTTPQGLPRRPWFRHQIYAPGFYTGYGVKTVPGVREAIEQKQWTEANQQIEIVARVIENYAAQVDRATEIARGRTE